ncbi:hypothetical protein HFN_1569 [Helicobacter fennelliae MRY12-0050]|uniref:DUF4492 domain-containing protein n=2 Tax=Helicobacter fennelliae TaxID=215 RepID=T1CW20_9HELI|nr:hypothetical protein HFN_1569 [Helicobacter fennelliae MRY12-0050]
MKLGKILWKIIFIKLFVLFVLLRFFVYDGSLKDIGDERAKSAFVLENLTKEQSFSQNTTHAIKE